MYCSILLQNIVFYDKCNILPQSVVFPTNYSNVNCSILQHNIVVYHKNNVLLQNVIFYHRVWYFHRLYTITNSSILLQSYHKI